MEIVPSRTGRRFRNPVTSEILYTPEEVEFMMALDLYKRRNKRPNPGYDEVLGVFRSLGYRKVCEVTGLPIFVRGWRKPLTVAVRKGQV